MRYTIFIITVFLPVFSYSQVQPSGFDYKKAEQSLEAIMQQTIEDPSTQEQVCAIASLVGVYQFVQHRYEESIRTLEYAISHSKEADEYIQILNNVFLVHALCLTHNRNALSRLRCLSPILLELQENTIRGNFPVEYADGMRMVMNQLLLPLTSLVSRTFPDQEALSYCFNLMLFLKQFSFYQLGNKTGADIKHYLYQDYTSLLSAKLQQGEVAIEFVPCIAINEDKKEGTDYVAYILNDKGKLKIVEVCDKKEVEELYRYNETSWQLYDDQSSQLSSLVWKKLMPYVNKKKCIYLSPCGILNRVNYLLFDSRIHELSSTYELAKTYTTNPHPRAVLIGDIDYDQTIASQIRGNRDWGKLKGTQIEIENVAKALSYNYDVTSLTKDKVSEQNVRQLCNSSPTILHFATHAICYTDSTYRSQYGYFTFPNNYYPEKPELTYTGLVLSGGNMAFKETGNRQLTNDGILLSEEISKLSLDRTSLVVLSACNSANGIFDDIEGTLGLVKAFKLAGVRTIIASLSKVDDEATSEFMSVFYRRLSQKEDMHNAFVNTISYMKTKHPTQPKFWAMFKIVDCR